MKTTLLFLSVFLSVSLFGQNVYIPDANFKDVLVGNSDINTNYDTEIQVSEATAYSGGINIHPFVHVYDLTGIEAFTNITKLDIRNNHLTSLDVSQNTAITRLYCNSNELTSLDVSQNTALIYLECSENLLTSLNTHGAIALEELVCYYNQLTSLDVSQNTALISLWCYINQLTSLDVSQNPTLYILKCQNNQLTCLNMANGVLPYILECNNNINLTCIESDIVTDWTFTGNWYVEVNASFSEDCNNDCSNTSSLTELTTSKNLIQILDLMGRETTFKPNTPLIYVYDDGSTEKVFSVEY